jgi:pheromone shutdown protein TraB
MPQYHVVVERTIRETALVTADSIEEVIGIIKDKDPETVLDYVDCGDSVIKEEITQIIKTVP